MPTAGEVVDLLGMDPGWIELGTVQARAEAALPIVYQMVKAYTRDRGFNEWGDPGEDLAAVILTSAARLAQNPHGWEQQSYGIDDSTANYRLASFTGWTLAELAVLNRHRKRAM